MAVDSTSSPWSQRFEQGLHPAIERFNASIGFDITLLQEDLDGSIAHARMLASTGVISAEEAEQLVAGLERLVDTTGNRPRGRTPPPGFECRTGCRPRALRSRALCGLSCRPFHGDLQTGQRRPRDPELVPGREHTRQAGNHDLFMLIAHVAIQVQMPVLLVNGNDHDLHRQGVAQVDRPRKAQLLLQID